MAEMLSDGLNRQAILLFSLFMLSQWGWWCFLGKISKANLYFLPSLAACIQITILVCVGVFNLLLPGTYLLFAIGVVFWFAFLLLKQNPFQYVSFLELAFLLCMIIIVYRVTRGRVLYQHDDFSHWGTVLNELLRVDHFSTGKPYLSEHLTYPLGSTVWIYAFSKVISDYSEPTWMFAQTLFMLYCLLPLFSFIPKQSGKLFPLFFLLFVFIFTNCILYYCTKIFELLVDTDVPLTGAAATLFAYNAGENGGTVPNNHPLKRISVQSWFLVPLLSATIHIKASGAFFAISAIAVLFLRSSAWKSKRKTMAIGGIFALSFAPYVLWRWYCSKHYSGLTIAHESSLSSFLRIFSQKSPEDISSIFHGTIACFFSSRFLIEFMIMLAVIFFIAILITDDSDFYQIGKALGYLFVAYFAYMLSTFGMFVFSMPRFSAITLSSVTRYQQTMLIYCYYFLICILFFSLSRINFVILRDDIQITSSHFGQSQKTERSALRYHFAHVNEQNSTPLRIQVSRVLILLCACILLSTGWYFRNNKRFLLIHDFYGSSYYYQRINCEAALKEAGVPDHAKCMVLRAKEWGIYPALLAFLLGADRNETKQLVIESSDQLVAVEDALYDDYWVLVVDQENELIQAWLAQQNDPHILMVTYK